MRRRLAFTLVAIALALGLAAVTAELAVRALHPTPRLQIFRLDQPYVAWTERDGVPLWWDPGYDHGPIRGPACAPGAPVVGVAGDSVLMTIDPEGDGHRVADVLRQDLGVCVRDGSWAGYLPYQELGMLRWIDAETPLTVGVLSVWKEDRHYWRLGDALYDSERVAHDPTDGLPHAPLPGMPHGLHHLLFTRSHAWEYATLATAEPVYDARDPAGAYLDAVAWAASRGFPLVLVEAVPLDRPLSEAWGVRASYGDKLFSLRIEAAAAAQGFPYVVLADALRDQDVEAIRLDTCCHFNSKGHALVARAILPHVRDALERAGSPAPR